MGEDESTSRITPVRISRVDVSVPLVLRENGKMLRIFVHPDVPMRNHFISKLDPQCVAKLPLGATHILLDLLPPHSRSTMQPSIEQRGFIEHRGDRRVLCGYWAQECLRIEGVAESGFWDLSGWSSSRSKGGEGVEEAIMVHDDDDEEGEEEDVIQPIQPIDELEFEMLSAPHHVTSRSQGTRLKNLRREEESSSQASTSGPSEQIITPRSARTYPDPISRPDKGKGRAVGMSPVRKRPRRSAVRSEPYFQEAPLEDEASTDEDFDHSSTEASSGETDHEHELPARPRTHAATSRPSGSAFHPRASTARAPRKKRPKLGDMTRAQIQEQYEYFLDFTHTAMKKEVQEDYRKMGTGKLVKQWMLRDVHHMWCEARKKYCRRNLDTMSIMLSTWKVSRDYKLSPEALRRYYTDFKGRIRAAHGEYVPVNERPPDWPFHRRPPLNPEAGIPWIFDWSSPGAIAFVKDNTIEGGSAGGLRGAAGNGLAGANDSGPSGTAAGVKDEIDSEEDMLDVEDGFLDTKEDL